MPPSAHTVRFPSVVFGIWKYRKIEVISLLTKACRLTQVIVCLEILMEHLAALFHFLLLRISKI